MRYDSRSTEALGRSTEHSRNCCSTVNVVWVGAVMTHVGCPSCCLRFTSAAAAHLIACPKCGRPPQLIARAEGVVGFSLFVPENGAWNERPEALAIAIGLPIPDPGRGRS